MQIGIFVNIAKFKENVLSSIRDVGFIRRVEVVDETANTIKIRLAVNNFCFIQVYVNLKKNISNYVVVLNGQRIYGRDCDCGKWHSHLWENPDKHKFTQAVPLKEFLFEAYEGLRNRGII